MLLFAGVFHTINFGGFPKKFFTLQFPIHVHFGGQSLHVYHCDGAFCARYKCCLNVDRLNFVIM